ncbi:hypothetical protein C0Q70_21585 [Pomacea canaliculata]|uniref:Uncharacterized protein n=1 Tax=Pomacea canaliculata TaxID=400727 RepID=A0A2T7NCX7_POMCA|nr:hypothetical protein C0Q70_21585 [Pomacea canaliculata]
MHTAPKLQQSFAPQRDIKLFSLVNTIAHMFRVNWPKLKPPETQRNHHSVAAEDFKSSVEVSKLNDTDPLSSSTRLRVDVAAVVVVVVVVVAGRSLYDVAT